MLELRPDDVQEAVGHGRAEAIVTRVFTAVAVVMIGIWLGGLSADVWSWISCKVVSGPCLIIILITPFLVASVCEMQGVVLFLMRKLRIASRIADIDDSEMLCIGSDDVGEPVQPPLVPIIPSSSSSPDGGARAGGNVASAADLQVGGESHHRRSGREGEVEMSAEAVSDGRGQNA